MASQEDLNRLATELSRVVDRLSSMPLNRAAIVADEVHSVAAELVERTREISEEIPSDAVIPQLAPHGLGSLLAVIGDDYAESAKAAPLSDVSPVIDRLVELRRSLP